MRTDAGPDSSATSRAASRTSMPKGSRTGRGMATPSTPTTPFTMPTPTGPMPGNGPSHNLQRTSWGALRQPDRKYDLIRGGKPVKSSIALLVTTILLASCGGDSSKIAMTPETPMPETPVMTPEAPMPETPVMTPEAPMPETPVMTPETPMPETPVMTPETLDLAIGLAVGNVDPLYPYAPRVLRSAALHDPSNIFRAHSASIARNFDEATATVSSRHSIQSVAGDGNFGFHITYGDTEAEEPNKVHFPRDTVNDGIYTPDESFDALWVWSSSSLNPAVPFRRQ